MHDLLLHNQFEFVLYVLYYAEMNTTESLLIHCRDQRVWSTVFLGHMLISSTHCWAEFQLKPPDPDPRINCSHKPLTHSLTALVCSVLLQPLAVGRVWSLSVTDANSVISLSVSIRHQTSYSRFVHNMYSTMLSPLRYHSVTALPFPLIQCFHSGAQPGDERQSYREVKELSWTNSFRPREIKYPLIWERSLR